MKTATSEFEPLDIERAKEIQTIINGAARQKAPVVLDPSEEGVKASAGSDLISPEENTNALARFQRHY